MSKTRVLMVRTLAVVVGSIAVVGLFVTGYVFTFEEPGARWGVAKAHISFGLIGGALLVVTSIVFHFIAGYLKHRLNKGNH